MNPETTFILDQLQDKPELLFGEVCIRRLEGSGQGFDLRHTTDAPTAEDQLKIVTLAELRHLAQYTEEGQFRPLRSAPSLARGWRYVASQPETLREALNQIYPGALADACYLADKGASEVTTYETFTERQTGMYRITTQLSDDEVGQVIDACCPASLCLKQRLWTSASRSADEPAGKSLLPCLEPCSLLLEFARYARRTLQDHPDFPQASPEELEAWKSRLAQANQSHPPEKRIADFTDPDNPRRLQWQIARAEVNHEG